MVLISTLEALNFFKPLLIKALYYIFRNKLKEMKNFHSKLKKLPSYSTSSMIQYFLNYRTSTHLHFYACYNTK